MTIPRVTVDLAKITHNSRQAVAVCSDWGIEVVGVTKGVWGLPEVVRALTAGGVRILADSRLQNISRMRTAGIREPIWLLRTPGPSEIDACVGLADASLNVDLDVLEGLSRAAGRAGKQHGIILMVDSNTGREGVSCENAPGICRRIAAMGELQLLGLGAYFHVHSNAAEHLAALRKLVAVARHVEGQIGVRLPLVSGGSSNIFQLFRREGQAVAGINQLRLGTAVLLGLYTSFGPALIDGFFQDAFVLEAELIEVKQRKGRVLGILSLGRLDTDPELLFPADPGVRLVDATNDHTVMDLSAMTERPRVGNRLAFQLGYSALSRLMIPGHSELVYR
jgi:predicted amino acid racemase